MADSGIRHIEAGFSEPVPVLPLDGLWQSLEGIPTGDKLAAALAYSGCEFHDEGRRFVKGPSISIAAIGGVPVAQEADTDDVISGRLTHAVHGSHVLMGSSANFSYLSDRDPRRSYQKVVELGHLSVAHTVQVSLVAAGISQAAELELSLQRDIVHLSKLTNARTKVQDRPPLTVANETDVPAVADLYEQVSRIVAQYRGEAPQSRDAVEFLNTFYPTRKATTLMITGSLRNFGKLVDFQHDDGKEQEFRDLSSRLKHVLGILWPELFNKGGEG